MFDIAGEVLLAERRIRPHVRETLVEPSVEFSRLSGADVTFKLENLQHTGSFKVRGALNKLLSMNPEDRARGIVTASTGNHGAAVAFAMNRVGAGGIVFVSRTAAQGKVRAIERLGAEVQAIGDDPIEAEHHARQYATDRGMTYISPYNDPQVVGGQGTVGVELARQLDRIDAVFVALGGGGLISGIAAHLKQVRDNVEIIGCSPVNSAVMVQSVRAGKILDLPSLPTLSDGTAGGLEPDTITLEPCRLLIDELLTVTEDEIADALARFVRAHSMLIEGAAAVAIASFLKLRERFRGRHVAIVVCGGNIDLETLKEVLDRPGAG